MTSPQRLKPTYKLEEEKEDKVKQISADVSANSKIPVQFRKMQK